MIIIFLYKNILTDSASSCKIKYEIYPYKQIVIISHSFEKAKSFVQDEILFFAKLFS